MHTLVIDDDPRRLRWLQDTLEKAGHAVRLASHPQAALDQFKETRFDLVFFDHDLGVVEGSRSVEMNGSRLLGEVLRSSRYKRPRAIWVHSANPVGAENIASKCRSAEIRYCTGSYVNIIADPKGFLAAVETMGVTQPVGLPG